MRFAATVVLIVTVAAGSAHAQTSSHGTEVITPADQQAQSMFLGGLEAFDRGDAARALELLRASYAIRPRPVVMLNIAQALRTTGHVVTAIEAFNQYLRDGGSTLPRDRVVSVRETVNYLRSLLASASITSDPPGATIRLDGVEVGRTPLTEGRLLVAGEHVIEAELPEYVVVREHVRFAAGERRVLNLRLAGLNTAATLAVSVMNTPAPASMRVLLDGIEVGAPPLTRQVDRGGHQLAVSAPGYETYRAEVVLAARQNRTLALRLNRTAPLYARPWVWTAAGAVVIVAIGAIVLGASLGPSEPRPDSIVLTPPP